MSKKGNGIVISWRRRGAENYILKALLVMTCHFEPRRGEKSFPAVRSGFLSRPRFFEMTVLRPCVSAKIIVFNDKVNDYPYYFHYLLIIRVLKKKCRTSI